MPDAQHPGAAGGGLCAVRQAAARLPRGVFETWLGGRWVLFDGTGLAPVDKLVRIGTGRDAKDVAFATMSGPQVQMTHMALKINGEGGGAPIVGGTAAAPEAAATA